jgi:hypothetical protein
MGSVPTLGPLRCSHRDAKKQRSDSSKQCASLSHHVNMIAVYGYDL